MASDTRSVTIAPGAVAIVPEIVRLSFGGQAALIIADENTYAAAGSDVLHLLQSAGLKTLEPFVFPAHPSLRADAENLLKLEQAIRPTDAIPVAVGSGTVNDLAKLASHECNRPYMVVATAASMDGYASFGAAITKDGFKRTIACPAPRAVVADLDVLTAAPKEMAAWGYGDLIGKLTAGADWLIADELRLEPIDRAAWPLVQAHLREWIESPSSLRDGDRKAIEHLTRGLIMSGLAMQIARSSRPASASEHQFSHLWEMQGLVYEGEPVPHGFKVALGTLASSALYECVLQRDLGRVNVEAICRSWPSKAATEQQVRRLFADSPFAEQAVEASLAKYTNLHELRERLALLQERWPDMKKALSNQLIRIPLLREVVRAAGCAPEPEAIGLDRPRLKASYAQARQIRSRYTILDLAVETGCFEECVEELFEHPLWPGNDSSLHKDAAASPNMGGPL